jgi:hypothetical protein
MTRAIARDSPGQDLAAIGQVAAQAIKVLVIDVFDFADAEGADLAAAEAPLGPPSATGTATVSGSPVAPVASPVSGSAVTPVAAAIPGSAVRSAIGSAVRSAIRGARALRLFSRLLFLFFSLITHDCLSVLVTIESFIQ